MTTITPNPHRLFSIIGLMILLVLLHEALTAQPVFVVDSIILPGTQIIRIRSSYNGEIWFLDNHSQFYRINRDNTLQNRTNEFSLHLNSAITDFVCVDTNEIIVGTDSNFAFYYKHGEFSQIGINYGLQVNENHIESLFLRHNLLKQYGDTMQNDLVFGISTNHKAYWNDTISNGLSELDNTYYRYDKKRFLSKNDPFFLNIPQSDGSRPSYYNLGGGIREFGDFTFADYGNLNCANIVEWTNGSYIYAWLGFDKGYVTKSYYSYESNRYLTSQKIYAIADVNDYYAIIAADSGLYLSNTHNDPHKIDLGIGNFTAYDLEVWQGSVYVASSIGLLKLTNSDCKDFHLDFAQDKQYVDTDISEEVAFEPVLSDSRIFKWDFNDGSFSTEKFPVHQYTSPGNYRIQLIGSNGVCADTSYGLVVAYAGSGVNDINFDQYAVFSGGEYPLNTETFNIADLDGDSHADLYFPREDMYKLTPGDTLAISPVEFLNTGFRTITCLTGDLNNDGLNDIISGTQVYVNLGDFKFRLVQFDLTEIEFFVGPVNCLLDYNHDGKLDIALGYASKMLVYLNKGDFNFEKIRVDIPEYSGTITDIKWIDIDNDHDNDIIISGLTRNNFLINENGHYTARDIPALSGLLIDNVYPADLNNDRYLDLYCRSGNGNHLFLGNKDSISVYDNTWLTNEINIYQSDGQFAASGVTFDDFDNNGKVDCMKSSFNNRMSRLFMNYGNMIFRNEEKNPIHEGSFTNITTLASADISDDGKVDIILDQTDYFNKSDAIYLNNSSSGNHWVKFHLYGSQSNLNAIGTKVFVKTRNEELDLWQYRVIESVHSDHAQNGYEVHFGLGEADIVDTLEISWTSGLRSIYTGLAANKTYEIIESLIGYTGDSLICENTNPVFRMPRAPQVNYEWLLNGISVSTDNVLKISKPGNYKCIIYYPDFTDTTQQINIHHKPVTPSFIWFQKDTIVCPGDSALISSDTAPDATYKWLVNHLIDSTSNRDFYYASDTLPVQQILVNSNGCSDTSKILTLSLYPAPEIKLDEPFELCDDDSIEVSVDASFKEFLWSNNDTVSKTWLNSKDTLWVKVWNEFNCSSTDTIGVVVWPKPVSVAGNDTTIGFTDSYAIIDCYSEPHTYYWNDTIGLCAKTFYGNELNIGVHQVILTIVNSHNCRSADTAYIQVVLNNIDPSVNEKDLFVFPNPAEEYIYLYINGDLNSNKTRVDIFDSAGNIVYSYSLNVPVPQVVTLDINRLDKGLYIIKVSANGKSEYKKLLIT